jgi:MSHA biogenesis protein MshP
MSAIFRDTQRGFSTATAIFLVVVLAALGAAILLVASMQHTSSAIDVQGARAYQAARAGIEWGMYQILDPNNAVSGPATLPSCFATTSMTLAGTLSAFSTTVSCAAAGVTTEANRNLQVYTIVALAKLGTAGSPNYVERQITATVSRCKDPSGTAPRYACP